MSDSPGGTPGALWHLTLPWARPPLLANDSIALKVRMRLKRGIRDDVALVARSLKLRPIAEPVVALLTWYRITNRVADSDNIAPTLKGCLDGLRAAGVLADDGPRQVTTSMQRVIMRESNPWPEAGERVLLSLFPAEHTPVVHIRPSPPATLAWPPPTP